MTDSSSLAQNDTVTVSNTVNKSLPYFVRPDNVLNDFTGSYSPGTQPANQGIYTTFSWSYNTGSGSATLSYTNGAAADTVPYVEVQFTGVTSGNPDTLVVSETSDGGCSGDPVKLPIEVVAEPSFNVTNNGTDSIGYEVCASGSTPIEIASFTDNNVRGGYLQFHVDSVVDQLNSDLSLASNITTSGDLYNVRMSEDSLGINNADLFTHDLSARNGKITRYTFNVYGMSDHISRKSDFLTNTAGNDNAFTYYNPTNGSPGSKITYIVYPKPQTGDIYYVPGTWDL
jgi:hypothetical protein